LGWSNVTLNNAAHLAKQWSAMGYSRMALTFGDQGAWLQVGETNVHTPAKVIDFVDSVGAGDTFWATCLADWLQAADWRNSADAQTRVDTTLDRALSAVAFNCAHTGCTPPSAEQLRQITRH
jgi:fructokinase